VLSEYITMFILKTLVERRKFILLATLLTTVLVAILSFALPQWYTAKTTIFPAEPEAGLSMYTEMLQTLQVPLLGPMGSGARPETIYIDMMKSRHIGAQLIEEFDLFNVYGVGLIEDALAEVNSHTGYTLLENGLVVVNFEDRDPDRAAAIANRYIELLDEFNREIAISRASKTRTFIEGQLEERRTLLARAETDLNEFQETNQALELEEQLRSAMIIVTNLTADAIALETELQIMEHYSAPSSDEFQRKKREYDEVLEQLKKLKLSADQEDEDLLHAYLPTLEEIPFLALQMLRLKRKVEVETTIYLMLLKEYEKSRIEEARDTPTVQVMDRASVPNLRSRPKRKILIVVGAVAGFGWSALLALVVGAWREKRDRSGAVADILRPVQTDLSNLFRRKK
jgi:tyrosine-protein kinase Etk/Wzc